MPSSLWSRYAPQHPLCMGICLGSSQCTDQYSVCDGSALAQQSKASQGASHNHSCGHPVCCWLVSAGKDRMGCLCLYCRSYPQHFSCTANTRHALMTPVPDRRHLTRGTRNCRMHADIMYHCRGHQARVGCVMIVLMQLTDKPSKRQGAMPCPAGQKRLLRKGTTVPHFCIGTAW